MFLKQHTTDRKRLLHLLAGIGLAGLILVINTFIISAQEEQDAIPEANSIAELDTLPRPDTAFFAALIKKHSPRKAVMYSLICPGLGQVYNKKYWKLPIVYGAGGTFAYFILYHQNKYEKFRDTYNNNLGANDKDKFFIDGLPFNYSNLPRIRDTYRRWRDLNIAGLGALYLLTVIDAMVDAYFFNYDISDDLSLKMEPALIQGPGITASLGFRINLGF